jgi:hypothetical protein
MRAIQQARKVLLISVFCASMFLLCRCLQLSAQVSSFVPDDLFTKYPVKTSFEGRPVPPVLADPSARRFRTRIREGVAKGVVFAGHYEVAVWGCGAGCLSFAIVDAVTGKVNFFPATVSQDNEAGERLTYRENSRAIHVIGSLNEEDSVDRWYVWNGKEFDLVSKRPALLLDDNGSPIKP